MVGCPRIQGLLLFEGREGGRMDGCILTSDGLDIIRIDGWIDQ
jgi:hypothetical protein